MDEVVNWLESARQQDHGLDYHRNVSSQGVWAHALIELKDDHDDVDCDICRCDRWNGDQHYCQWDTTVIPLEGHVYVIDPKTGELLE